MKVRKHQIVFYCITFLGLLFYIASLFLVKIDTEFTYRWVSFVLWVAGVLLVLLAVIAKKSTWHKYHSESQHHVGRGAKNSCSQDDRNSRILALLRSELVPFLFIALLAVVSRSIFLENYPFVSMGDEVRDGGLNAAQIANGEIKNIFGWGRYESHGLIIPTATSFFYKIFKNSVFTYRVPAAALSVLNILVIYFLARRIGDRKTAFFAALVLICSPQHLLDGRTRVVGSFSGPLTSFILFAFYLFIQNTSIKTFTLLGLILGFSSGFHPSVRTIVLTTIVFALVIALHFICKEGCCRIKTVAGGLFLFVVAFFVGFGPRLLFTSPEIFFHISKVPFLERLEFTDSGPSVEILSNQLSSLGQDYWTSLKVYAVKPLTVFGVVDLLPILCPVLAMFFVFGVVSAVVSPKSLFERCLAGYVFLIPLTNSAITDCLNCENRLLPASVVAAIVTALGITWVFSKAPHRLARFLRLVLSLYVVVQGYTFFSAELSSKGRLARDYLSMHTIYLLKPISDLENICLIVSPIDGKFFDFMHVKEQYEYFLPETEIELSVGDWVLDNTIYISKTCEPFPESFVLYQPCLEPRKFVCPLEGNADLKLYVENSLVKERVF